MAADNLLKNYSVMVDGIGKAGNCGAYKPPVLTIKTTDFQSGDMDMAVPVDDGMEPMEATYSVYGMDEQSHRLFGFVNGSGLGVTVRTSYQNRDGQVKACVDELRGTITGVERDEQTTGSQKEKMTKVTMKLQYYRSVFDGQELVEIDAINGVRKLGGVDQLANIRSAMGL
ncbi:phage major tail tube protein [Marinagarivorans algicola]|uniref:phage major tail tube protein n=1 Tax=Marinagarivorans algicola TaxID=1513270 RepID=UPI0006B4A36F|nr:phage major tail tube protein [Marinagarivorans algicola]